MQEDVNKWRRLDLPRRKVVIIFHGVLFPWENWTELPLRPPTHLVLHHYKSVWQHTEMEKRGWWAGVWVRRRAGKSTQETAIYTYKNRHEGDTPLARRFEISRGALTSTSRLGIPLWCAATDRRSWWHTLVRVAPVYAWKRCSLVLMYIYICKYERAYIL